LTKPSGIPVADAVAKEAPGGSVSGGGKATGASMLDASGYVVARRSATVASKSILRGTDVLIEEGQRVKEGEAIARLDDSNTKANLLQAQPQVTQPDANLAAAKVALDDAAPIFRRNERQFE